MNDDNEIFTGVDAALALRSLPDKHRVVMSLWAAGYNQRECGEIVGLSRAAVGIIRKKTVTMLRKDVE